MPHVLQGWCFDPPATTTAAATAASPATGGDAGASAADAGEQWVVGLIAATAQAAGHIRSALIRLMGPHPGSHSVQDSGVDVL